MSRIGRLPVALPDKVTVTVGEDNLVTVKGPLGELKRAVNKNITVKTEEGVLTVHRPEEKRESKINKSMHGLYRKLIANMVEGVTKGYQKSLIVNGVGYKVNKQGDKVVLNIGFSHSIEMVAPAGITFEVPTDKEIVVKGIDRELVGQAAANIRILKKPDPYHAYGIRYKDEVIARKEGKKAGK